MANRFGTTPFGHQFASGIAAYLRNNSLTFGSPLIINDGAGNPTLQLKDNGTLVFSIVNNAAITTIANHNATATLRIQPTTGNNSIITTFPGASTLGFFGSGGGVQPSSTGEATGFTAGGGTTATHLSTWTGNSGTKAYTVSDIVKHLKFLGLLASS